MPDVYLRSVASDADPDDVRLYDPTAAPGGGPIIVPVARADETDSVPAALALTKRVNVALAAETDTALARALVKQKAAGVAAETDSAFTSALVKRVTTGLGAETDTGLARALTKKVAAGLASETDIALPRGVVKQRAFGLAVEADSAVTQTLAKRVAVAQASEADAALGAAGLGKRLAVGVASETDAALAPVLGSGALSVGVATEVDAAIARGLASIGLPEAVTPSGGGGQRFRRWLEPRIEPRREAVIVAVGAADETDEAVAPALRKRASIGSAVEASGAAARPWRVRLVALEVTMQHERARALVLCKRMPVRGAAAVERSSAQRQELVRIVRLGASWHRNAAAPPRLRRRLIRGSLPRYHETASARAITKRLVLNGAGQREVALALQWKRTA